MRKLLLSLVCFISVTLACAPARAQTPSPPPSDCTVSEIAAMSPADQESIRVVGWFAMASVRCKASGAIDVKFASECPDGMCRLFWTAMADLAHVDRSGDVDALNKLQQVARRARWIRRREAFVQFFKPDYHADHDLDDIEANYWVAFIRRDHAQLQHAWWSVPDQSPKGRSEAPRRPPVRIGFWITTARGDCMSLDAHGNCRRPLYVWLGWKPSGRGDHPNEPGLLSVKHYGFDLRF